MRRKDQPLSPAKFQILLALSGEEMYGYKIIKEVERMSGGHFSLGPGTFYDNLQKLMDEGFVEDLGYRKGDEDPRRRYYRLSPSGFSTLSTEVSRLQALVWSANLRLAKAGTVK